MWYNGIVPQGGHIAFHTAECGRTRFSRGIFMIQKHATIFNIERGSYVDGPGIRTTVFFKGCNLRCAWCHNPESQSNEAEMMFYQNKCIGCGTCKKKCPHALTSCTLCGACTQYCPGGAREICGKTYTVDEILCEILKDRVYYEAAGGGVTFSGGECMLQIDFLSALLKRCKANGIHTAVDTAGHVPYEYFERVMEDTDLFLYDVKCLNTEKHKEYTGVGNERILDNLKKLLVSGKDVWVRIPIISEVNDTETEMQEIRQFFDTYGTPRKVELLPYHAMGEHKYTAIGRSTVPFSAPDGGKMEQLQHIFL